LIRLGFSEFPVRKALAILFLDALQPPVNNLTVEGRLWHCKACSSYIGYSPYGRLHSYIRYYVLKLLAESNIDSFLF